MGLDLGFCGLDLARVNRMDGDRLVGKDGTDSKGWAGWWVEGDEWYGFGF